ncbi:MAG: chitobiase/beta-hexosaminidase C-terminal domain-containing protein [Candidatus Thermoplasmatota archaeon]|nr:chitobiase/beta-hexosaminidase C-terminal domain-containing protein [Candidatus Thermoplasmatota archaeon]
MPSSTLFGITAVAIAALFLFPHPIPEADEGATLTWIDLSVMTMIERVRTLRDRGLDASVPMDGTTLLRLVQDEGEYSYSSRSNPPPASWTLVHTGTYCRVFVAQGESVPQSEIEALANTFDERIYPNATSWFHPDDPPSRIDIRIYDMGDGEGGVGGFFIRSFPTRNDLFVDSSDVGIADEVLAHEFQHLLHYDLDPNEEVWLDEGLADLSIRISLGPDKPALQSHVLALELYPVNDLLDWGEGTPPDYYESIADYGAAYTFIAYLTEHYGGKGLIADLVKDPLNSIASVDNVLAAYGHSDRFGDVYSKVKAANLLDEPVYGGGVFDQGLIDIGIRTMYGGSNTYPYSVNVSGTKRYSGYYFRFDSGRVGLKAVINSSESVHATFIGLDSGSVIWSDNASSGGGVPGSIPLDGFGTEYDTLYAIPSTEVKGSSFSLEIVEIEIPRTTFLIDPPAPDGLLGYYRTPPTITLSSEDAMIRYRWGLGLYELYTSPITAPEGTSRLEFYSLRDGASETPVLLEFDVDSIPPLTILEIDPPEPDGDLGLYSTSPTISLSTESGASTYYIIDGDTVSYTGPFTVGEGETTLLYWSVDPVGNEEERRSFLINVDSSPPVASIVLDPPSPDGKRGYYTSDVTVSFQYDTGSSVLYSMNGGDEREYTGPFIVGDGTHTINYWARRDPGRMGPELSVILKVDTIAPEVSFALDPPLADGWNRFASELEVSSNEGDMIFYRISSEEAAEYISPILLADGDHSVEIWAEDQAGNIGGPKTFRARIDTMTPRTSLSFSRDPDSGIWFHDAIPEVIIERQAFVLSPERTYYSVNEGESRLFQGSMEGLVSGINRISYYSVDEAGNQEGARSKQVGLDLARPVPSLKANRTIVGGSGPVLFDMSASSDDNAVNMFRVHFGDGTDSGWVRDPIIVHYYDGLGDRVAYGEVVDVAGRISTLKPSVRIEVLTPEEAARRLQGNDRAGIVPLIVLILIVIAGLAAVAALAFVLLRRGRRSASYFED